MTAIVTVQSVKLSLGDARIFLDHQETFATGRPTRHRLELDLAGYRYRFDRLALPLAEGGGLPAMMLVFVEFDPRASREF
jgi:hypothetical protein